MTWREENTIRKWVIRLTGDCVKAKPNYAYPIHNNSHLFRNMLCFPVDETVCEFPTIIGSAELMSSEAEAIVLNIIPSGYETCTTGIRILALNNSYSRNTFCRKYITAKNVYYGMRTGLFDACMNPMVLGFIMYDKSTRTCCNGTIKIDYRVFENVACPLEKTIVTKIIPYLHDSRTRDSNALGLGFDLRVVIADLQEYKMEIPEISEFGKTKFPELCEGIKNMYDGK